MNASMVQTNRNTMITPTPPPTSCVKNSQQNPTVPMLHQERWHVQLASLFVIVSIRFWISNPLPSTQTYQRPTSCIPVSTSAESQKLNLIMWECSSYGSVEITSYKWGSSLPHACRYEHSQHIIYLFHYVIVSTPIFFPLKLCVMWREAPKMKAL